MKFNLYTKDLSGLRADCAIIGIYEKMELTPSAAEINTLSQHYLKKLLKNNEFQAKAGQTLMLYSIPHLPFSRVLLVGCGKQADLKPGDYRKIIFASIKALNTTQTTHAATFLTELAVENQTLAWKIKQQVEVTKEATYTFHTFKSSKEPKPTLQTLTLPIDKHQQKACELALNQGICVANGVEFTKNLANLPSNICTPSYIATEAKNLKRSSKAISVKILEEKEMKKLGMNALLAVTRGSTEPAKLICIEYKGTSRTKAPIALVGKGITFDTGGISLKPADSMVGMKYDMCGAATVLGAIKAAAELKLKINIIGIIACAENMPSGSACKPEDIVTSLSGQTIEIMNTDAEGRLVLCDALTYSERYQPDTVIDIATLTGAVVIALGYHASGMLSNNDTLAKDLRTAGLESHDRVWQMPLWEEYQDQLKSPFADMSNVGGRAAGVITAACFLSRFTKKFHWAHLDVAGTAAMMGVNDRYATGRPVPLLMQYLINRAEK